MTDFNGGQELYSLEESQLLTTKAKVRDQVSKPGFLQQTNQFQCIRSCRLTSGKSSKESSLQCNEAKDLTTVLTCCTLAEGFLKAQVQKEPLSED
jgi:hypothetical protein